VASATDCGPPEKATRAGWSAVFHPTSAETAPGTLLAQSLRRPPGAVRIPAHSAAFGPAVDRTTRSPPPAERWLHQPAPLLPGPLPRTGDRDCAKKGTS